MKRHRPPEGPTADEVDALMAQQRRRLVAWTQPPKIGKEPAERMEAVVHKIVSR